MKLNTFSALILTFFAATARYTVLAHKISSREVEGYYGPSPNHHHDGSCGHEHHPWDYHGHDYHHHHHEHHRYGQCAKYRYGHHGPPSKAPPPGLATTNWIWTKEAEGGKNPPAGARPFRKVLNLDHCVDTVTIDITTDNFDTLYVNGKVVGSGLDWWTARRYTVRFEATKQVVIAAWAGQYVELGPAGLMIAGVAWNSHKEQPSTYLFGTDSTWKTQSKTISPQGFLDALHPRYNDNGWENVFVGGPFPSSPWGAKIVKPTREFPWSPRVTNIKGNADAPEAPPANVL